MNQVVKICKKNGVSIGAHPSFNDPENFGRKRLNLPPLEIKKLIIDQINILSEIAKTDSMKVTHVKPHGALNNMACEDFELASIIAKAIIEIDALDIIDSGNLVTEPDSSLRVLLDSHIHRGSLSNQGSFNSSNLFIENGIFENQSSSSVQNTLRLTKGSLINNGSISAAIIESNQANILGDGTFKSDTFLNNGTISPGNPENSIGTLTFKSHLINKGKIEIFKLCKIANVPKVITKTCLLYTSPSPRDS